MVFTWEGDLPVSTPAGITLAGVEVDGVFERGFECYGIPIGTDNYVKHMLKAKASEIVNDAKRTVELLSVDRQSLWSALMVSISHRCEYFCQLSPPSLSEPVAAELDREVGKCWRKLQVFEYLVEREREVI